ncbi:MAG TPA: hypothetical protein VKF61_07695, partial [Candidatus Polarisedimenticolia bacterium]|nr:hypothetical protein [Candidatus Polarisedimenticolia bacterium]
WEDFGLDPQLVGQRLRRIARAAQLRGDDVRHACVMERLGKRQGALFAGRGERGVLPLMMCFFCVADEENEGGPVLFACLGRNF